MMFKSVIRIGVKVKYYTREKTNNKVNLFQNFNHTLI